MLNSNLKIPDNREIKKSVAVWLISISDKKILLQKRAEIDMGKLQSNLNICQPTLNGKLEVKENLIDAVKRESEEELGKEFTNFFDFSKLNFFDSNEYYFNGKNFISYNYWGVVNSEQLKLVKLHSGAKPDFVKVGIEDIDNIRSKNDKDINLEKQVVLFEDQYQILRKLFSLKDISYYLK